MRLLICSKTLARHQSAGGLMADGKNRRAVKIECYAAIVDIYKCITQTLASRNYPVTFQRWVIAIDCVSAIRTFDIAR